MESITQIKSSSSSGSGSMSSGTLDDVEFPVFVGGCQKWVTGLTKRTTCDDVIYALLIHDNNPNDIIDVQCYAIFERWRGVERPLRGRTKIIKIWRAWGAERENVKFSVRKMSDPMDTSSEASRGKRTRKHHPSWRDRNRRNQEPERHSCERCNRGRDCPKHQSQPAVPHTVKKEKTDKYKSRAFHDLVHRILEQEKMIQEQLSRIKETDTHIESYETKVHVARMKENGANYVQEAYLKDKDSDSSSSGDDLFPAIKANDIEAYARICDNILELEERISAEESRILDLSVRVQEESMLSLPPEIPPASSSSCDILKEIEFLRKDVQRSISLSQAQHQQNKLVMDTIQDCEWRLQRKEALMDSLVDEVKDIPEDDVATDEDSDAIISSAESPDHGYNEMPVDCDFEEDDFRDDSPPPVPPPPSEYIDSHYKYLQPRIMNTNRDSQTLPTIPEHILEHSQPPPKPPRMNFPPPTEIISPDLPFYVTKVSTLKDYQWSSKNNSDNESNSDTGLSSLHSDESPAILETLV